MKAIKPDFNHSEIGYLCFIATKNIIGIKTINDPLNKTDNVINNAERGNFFFSRNKIDKNPNRFTILSVCPQIDELYQLIGFNIHTANPIRPLNLFDNRLRYP